MARGGGGAGRGGGGISAGGGGDTINAELDNLDTQMLGAFQMYRDTILQTWDAFAGNHGQLMIVKQHIMPASQQHIHQAKEKWPYSGDPDSYLESVMQAFDSDVMERAFSGTIYDLYDGITGYWLDADNWQNEHNFIMGGQIVVHSTNPPWVA